jgi:hypothetical protein
MAALQIARRSLLLSFLAYLGVLAAIFFELFDTSLAMLLGWLTVLAIAVSATACVAIQILGLVRRKR